MKTKLLVIALLFLLGCATYKQLKPEPELSPSERGYFELKKGKKNFELKQGKKYFIAFPGPQADHFYLVLRIHGKENILCRLTSSLIKKSIPGKKIKDESEKKESLAVYPIDKKTAMYYWLIDTVKQDFLLQMSYRYTPQWRFKFENKHQEFRATLKSNRVNRDIYRTLGKTFHFNNFRFQPIMDTVNKCSSELDKVLKMLLEIESIFPKNIVGSKDEAYLNFTKLKKDLEEEMAFQANYLAVLSFFKKVDEAKGNTTVFLKSATDFISFFDQKEKHPAHIIEEAKTVLGPGLGQIVPFYDQRLAGKDDAVPFDSELYLLKEFNDIGKLYQTSGIPTPREYTNLSKYIEAFDKRSGEALGVNTALEMINKKVTADKQPPSNNYFPETASKVLALKKRVPAPIDRSFGKYAGYVCSKKLKSEIARLTAELSRWYRLYTKAAGIVPPVNELKQAKKYSGMLGILRKNMSLRFLVDKYKAYDKISVKEQATQVANALKQYQWRKAESALKKLYRDKNYLNPEAVRPLKQKVMSRLEDSLYIKIDKLTRYNVRKFLKENVETFENVDSLYQDSVFFPVYDVTFSTGSKRELIRRKEQLVADLAKMKEDEFPARAVKLLYDEFMKDPHANGVLRARAIVTHGKHYKGEDKKTKRRIAECDPWKSKWIVKPKQYRRIFALPTTDKKAGVNTYVFRLNVRVPTKAKFPVYDVNIKLPKYVAKNAATKQWYQRMTLNKKLLKNEGRFTISAPTASNNYECQITPVRMKKDKSNYLEVKFKHKSFRVIPMSVMVQKPIIKKN